MTLQVTPTDPNGWSYVDEIWVRISPNHDGTNACMVLIIPDQNFMALFTDDQSSWTAVPFGGNPPAQNSQCTLNGQGSSLTYNGQTVSTSTNVTVTLNLQFSPSFRGSNFVDEYIWDSAFSTTAGWGTLGNLNVAAPPIITSGPALPFGIVNTPNYYGAATAQGGSGTYRWSATGLPSGLGIDAGTGIISGTPSSVGTFRPTITVQDSQNSTASSSPTLPVMTSAATSTPPANNLPMSATRAGVFRDNDSFLEDTNGNGTYDAGVDRFIPTFTGPGGFVAGDVPVVGDWTGNGTAKAGIYRASTGVWYLDANDSGTYDAGDYVYSFAGQMAGDIPMVGNWCAGDISCSGAISSRDCVGIYRSNGSFWILDLNCDGTFEGNPTDAYFPFGGLQGDVPVIGKWTGAKTRVGVVRKYAPGGVPQGNPFYWVLDAGDPNVSVNDPPAQWPSDHPADVSRCFAFGGLTGDVFTAGDWYNTGTTTAGVYRNGFWVLDGVLPGFSQNSHLAGLAFGYGGKSGDVPVPGSWTPAPSSGPIVALPYTGSSPITVTQAGSPTAISVNAYLAPNVSVTVSALAPNGVTVTPSPTILSASGPVNVSVAASSAAALGPQSITITYTCNSVACSGAAPVTQSLNITVNATAPLLITTGSLPTSVQGMNYSQVLTATGGIPPYHWSVASGTLPSGLTVYDNGTITGIPASGGAFQPTMAVMDSAGNGATAPVNMTTLDFTLSQPSLVSVVQSGAPVTVSISTAAVGGLTGSVTLTATNNTGAGPVPSVTMQLSQTPVPLGSAFNATVQAPSPGGTIFALVSPYTLTLPVTAVYNSNGQRITKTVSVPITVLPPPSVTISAPSTPIVLPTTYGSTVTFTQTVTGLNGFTGPVNSISMIDVQQVLGTDSNGNYLYHSVNGNILNLSYDNLPIQLSAANPTQTVTGHLTVAGIVSNYFTSNSCICFVEFQLSGAGIRNVNAIVEGLPGAILATIGTVPAFTISGVPALTTIAGSSTQTPGSPTAVTVMVNPVNGNNPQSVSFNLQNQGYRVNTTVTQPSGTPAGSPWPATFNISAVSGAQSGTVTVTASAGSLGSVPFSLPVTLNPAFTITASPSTQTTTSTGTVTYQISLNSGSGFTGTVQLQTPTSSPSLPSATWSKTQLTGTDTALLTIPAPSVTTATTYTVTVIGTSGALSSSTQLTIFANPPASGTAAQMQWPVDKSIIMTSPGAAAPKFSWTKGIGVTQYQLVVKADSQQPSAPIYYSGNFGPETQSASIPGLPTDGTMVSVNLVSVIGSNPGDPVVGDPTGPQRCHSGGLDGSSPHPTKATTPGLTYVLNANPLSEQGQLSGAAIYTYTLDQGADPRDIIGCYSPTSGDQLGIGIYSVSAPPQHSFQMQYSATDNVSTGNHIVHCKWEDPSTDLIWDFPLEDTNDGYSVGVFDATPVITGTNEPYIYAGDQSGTVQLTINGHNFGQSGTLTFCQGPGPCSSSDPNVGYTSNCVGCGWSPDSIIVGLMATSGASGLYSVAIASSTGASGNGFVAPPIGGGSQSVPQSAFTVVTPGVSVTVNGSTLKNGECAHITAQPSLPNISMQATPAIGGNVRWSMAVAYQRGEGTTDQTLIQSAGTVPIGQPWLPYSGNNVSSPNWFQGGNAVATWALFPGGVPSASTQFCIDGLGPNGQGANPDESTVLQFVKAQFFDTAQAIPYWAFPKIIAQESSYIQFCPPAVGTICSINHVPDGQPLRDSGFGFGLMQLTSPKPVKDALWNWQLNLFYGWYDWLSPYIAAGNSYWLLQKNAYKNYTGSKVQPDDPMYQSYWQYPYCTFSYTANDSPPSFGDAETIRLYNGNTLPAGSPQGTPKFYVNFDNAGAWTFSPLNADNRNYVMLVCGHADQF